MDKSQFRDLIERIRQKVDIRAVIGRHIRLNSHGMGLCPFHQEKTPSFSVNSGGRYFHCFGCGVAGDVFTFLKLYEKKSFWDVFSQLGHEAGVSLAEVSNHRDQIEE